jgi:hypothetical protein
MRIIRSRRMSLAGHFDMHGEMKNEYRILVGNLKK